MARSRPPMGEGADIDVGSLLGRTARSSPAAVPPVAVAAYARAIGARHPTGGALPAMLVVRPAMGAVGALLADHAAMPGLVHLAHDMTWSAPAPSAARLGAEATVSALLSVGGRAGAYVDVSVRDEHVDLASMRLTVVWAAPAAPDAVPWTGARDRVRALDVVDKVDLDLPGDAATSYAEASGDRNPIHLDEAAAVAAGFERPIFHGLGTLACVVEAASAFGRPRRARCRFARPVHPGQRLGIELRATERPGQYAIRCTSEGAPVLRDCVVAVDGAGSPP